MRFVLISLIVVIIISWQIEGEIVETVADFIFLGSKITADGDCSHEIQFSSVQFSHEVVSDSLRPHELQHARPPCPSPTPKNPSVSQLSS